MGIKEDFTAASTFPVKLLHNKVYEKGKFIPKHIQIVPTNACNLNCSFCCCSDVDRKKSLTFEQIVEIINIGWERGTKAITITGGGEPLLYPHINKVIIYAELKGIEVGMVNNGTQLDNLGPHKNLTWIRISCSDEREHDFDKIKRAIKLNPKTDWSFSYVVTREPNYENMIKLIKFANENKFTHMRLTTDLADVDAVETMEFIKAKLKGKVDDSLVVYQERKETAFRGAKKCYMSLMKPYICPEGIFPCCGVQYALKNDFKKDMPNNMESCDINDFANFLDNQVPFDGSVCDICYYKQYNEMLDKIKTKPSHLEFV